MHDHIMMLDIGQPSFSVEIELDQSIKSIGSAYSMVIRHMYDYLGHESLRLLFFFNLPL